MEEREHQSGTDTWASMAENDALFIRQTKQDTSDLEGREETASEVMNNKLGM